MDSETTVKIGYSSGKNISFRGWIETGIEREEWDQMTEEAQDKATEAAFWEADVVNLWAIPPDEDPDNATTRQGWR